MSKFFVSLALLVSLIVSACSAPTPLDGADGGLFPVPVPAGVVAPAPVDDTVVSPTAPAVTPAVPSDGSGVVPAPVLESSPGPLESTEASDAPTVTE